MDATGEEIRFERRGALGLVVLDRPKALNALSRGMCASFRRQLDLWEADPAVTRVAVRSSSLSRSIARTTGPRSVSISVPRVKHGAASYAS